jgi:hypothetical protein
VNISLNFYEPFDPLRMRRGGCSSVTEVTVSQISFATGWLRLKPIHSYILS